jgi:lipopolysaccharide transport system permease protein
MESSQDIPVIHIRPSKGWIPLNLKEMWDNRELLYFFIWRNIKLRYKQTLLGVVWTILVPLANTFIFTLFFGKLAKLPTDGLPQPVFYMAGLVVWKYFSTALISTSNSLVGSSGLLTKVYLPRLLIPLSACITGLVDFVIALGALILLMFYFQVVPAATALLLPVLVLIALGTAFGVGLFFTALNVKYRDVEALVPFIVQLWMYGSVIVPFSMIPERFGPMRYLYGLNPMAGVVEGFRWCLMHHVPGATIQAPLTLIAIGVPVTIVMLLCGLYYFKRMENQFADIV